MKDTIAYSNTLLKAMIIALLGWVVFQPDPVIAKIYKYKDDNGKVHFTDDASRIPLRYRKQDTVKKFKGVNEPTPNPGAPPGFPGQETAVEEEEDEGLSPQEEALVKRTIQVFQSGIALSNHYKSVQPNFANVRGLIDAMQSGLPQKESLSRELEGTRVPELKEAQSFLKQSIAIDRKTDSAGAGLKKVIIGIFNRVHSDAQKQAALIRKLEQALKESKKKKAEAAKKKLKEAQKEFEKKKSETEKRQAEEAQ